MAGSGTKNEVEKAERRSDRESESKRANMGEKRSYQHTIYGITATHIYNMCIEMISVYAIFH